MLDYTFQWGTVWREWPKLLDGALLTLELTVASFAIGTVIAVALALARDSKWGAVRYAATGWVEIARNTPCLFQIYLAYFGVGALGWNIDSYLAVLGAITFNNAGYMAEIVRGGLKAIHPGQKMAASALGIRPSQRYWFIIFPQLIPIIYYPSTNQLIWALLNTSLGMIVGLEELTGAAYSLQSTTFRAFEFFLITALIYYVLVKVILFASRLMAGRLIRRPGES